MGASGEDDEETAHEAGRQRYMEEMLDMIDEGEISQLVQVDMKDCGHAFWNDNDTAPRNLSRLNKDIELLLKGLPLDGYGSIFVAQDRKKLHFLKAVSIK